LLAEVLDRIIAYAASDEASLLAAQKEWAELAGRVFDDDPLYEERATAFLEWFALDRVGGREGRGEGVGRRPVERFLASERLSDLEGSWAFALARSHRALFELVEKLDGEVLVADLLGRAQFQVTERRRLPGLADGDVFEARIIANIATPPQLLFSRAFQFHPREAARVIKRRVRALGAEGASRDDILFRFAHLRWKAQRWAHVPAEQIYDGTGPDEP